MNKRVYGVIGISSIMANWNADFSGYPKTTTDNMTFGSDKALKYTMKKLWDEAGQQVLYIKSFRMDPKNGIVPRTLRERYEYIFNVEDLTKEKDQGEVLKKLFQAVDVKNFGATFAEAKNNLSITGAVQFGQGFNLYEGTEPQEQNILSPFKDSKKEDAKNSTLGTKIVSNEAHYFYPFVINPLAYKEYEAMGVTEGYTEDDYAGFKKAALVGATAYASNSKEGCENEFGLFIETEADCYLPNLSDYIRFSKGKDGEKNKISLNCGALLTQMGRQIQNTEVYYNPYTTELSMDLPKAKYFNIITMEEV